VQNKKDWEGINLEQAGISNTCPQTTESMAQVQEENAEFT
jgi:hypothetical protein